MQAAAPTPPGGERRLFASGLALIAISASAFGAMAIFARFAYAGGADALGALIARFTIACAFLTALMVAKRRAWPRGRALAVAVAMGAVGYVGQAVCYFSALNYASA